MIGKALLRLNVNFATKYFIELYFKNAFKNIDDYDLVFFVNPESITPKIINKYIGGACKVVTYMWDSFKNKPNAIGLISCSDKFFTFDNNDAERYKINFLPLFYTDDFKIDSCNHTEVYDVLFIGTAHSQRYNIVKRITRNLNAYLFFYSPSRFVFYFKKYFLGELKNMPISDISFTSMDKEQVLDKIMKSKSLIDVSHPDQDGLTIRTIESIGSNKKLITTNGNVIKYDFFNKNNILVLTEKTTSSDVECFLMQPYQELPEDIYRKYAISNWINNIVS
ncbi:hypothetical protein [Photobacterium sp. Hal280]|uniref:hypothetical protein n=1 Tax=Photobacterium sp. Hal280 TaxID=3035163 RepID=UPI00301E3A51